MGETTLKGVNLNFPMLALAARNSLQLRDYGRCTVAGEAVVRRQTTQVALSSGALFSSSCLARRMARMPYDTISTRA